MKIVSVFIVSATLVTMLACSNTKKVTSQVVEEEKKLSDTAWIHLMNDSTANYYKAVENFEAFWKDKRKPIEEKELFANAENGEVKKIEPPLDNNEPAVKYSFEYKAFKHWQRDMLPYVQANGRILTQNEKLEIWRQQQEQIKKQNQQLNKTTQK